MRYEIIENNKTSNDESIFKLIKNGLDELYRKKWKYVFIVSYITIAFFLWNMACALYELTTFNELPELIYKIISIAYYSIITTVLILLLFQVIIVIGKISNRKLKNRCEIGFKRCGLKTTTNEVPTLRNVYKDYQKEHGIIYEFNNLQIPQEVWDKYIPNIQLILKGIVYNMEVELDNDITRIPIMPNKYVSPYLVYTGDPYWSTAVNLLIVGKTGFR